jgi:hypothetical protein
MDGLSKFLVFLSTCISKSGQNGPFYMVYSNQYFFQIQKPPVRREIEDPHSFVRCGHMSYVIRHMSDVVIAACFDHRIWQPCPGTCTSHDRLHL